LSADFDPKNNTINKKLNVESEEITIEKV
jgi:hypothetical protein